MDGEEYCHPLPFAEKGLGIPNFTLVDAWDIPINISSLLQLFSKTIYQDHHWLSLQNRSCQQQSTEMQTASFSCACTMSICLILSVRLRIVFGGRPGTWQHVRFLLNPGISRLQCVFLVKIHRIS